MDLMSFSNEWRAYDKKYKYWMMERQGVDGTLSIHWLVVLFFNLILHQILGMISTAGQKNRINRQAEEDI
jgi:hypothetical protein